MGAIGDSAWGAWTHITQFAFTLDTFVKRAFSPVMQTGAFTMRMKPSSTHLPVLSLHRS